MSEIAGGGRWGGPGGGEGGPADGEGGPRGSGVPGGDPWRGPPGGQSPAQPPTCYAHPGRVAGSVCRRCNRPICPDCMTEAPVGWQCRACVRAGSRRSPVSRWQPVRPGYGRLGATRMTPVVVAVIVVNVVVYVWEMSGRAGAAVVNGRMIEICPHIAECKYGLLPVAVHNGEWYRLITAAFLHVSIEHIAFNMFTLAIVGAPVEAELGRLRFIGSVGSYLLGSPLEVGIGASGAIFGLMGAYFIIARRRRWDISVIVALIAINLLFSFTTTGIDWRAHLGGLVVGAVVGTAMTRSGRGWQLGPTGEMAVGIGAAVVVAAILSLLVTLPPGQVNL
jgi:membrane associated rhomboid family serine protease